MGIKLLDAFGLHPRVGQVPEPTCGLLRLPRGPRKYSETVLNGDFSYVFGGFACVLAWFACFLAGLTMNSSPSSSQADGELSGRIRCAAFAEVLRGIDISLAKKRRTFSDVQIDGLAEALGEEDGSFSYFERLGDLQHALKIP